MTEAQEEKAKYFLQHAEIRDTKLQQQLNEFLIELGLEHTPRLGIYKPPVKK